MSTGEEPKKVAFGFTETSLKTILHDIWQIDTELSIASSKDYPYGLGKEWNK